MTNRIRINKFKEIVKRNCKNPSFAFHEFFIEDHLALVEKISLELCQKYPDADRELVQILVWFHDFGKPIDIHNERAITLNRGVVALKECGFYDELINRVVAAWKRMEMKNEIDLKDESIEVQIVSSADGAAHLAGKFISTYFRDDNNESLNNICKRIRNKIIKDWERKITLPEVKRSFAGRYAHALEIVGEYPDKFIDS